ncbi:transposase [bacterium]|nr:transposase [bacterium]|tara:strand:- start:150 stop:695 length:546 start_codon:yes stop_codon:yes gene_type:complete
MYFQKYNRKLNRLKNWDYSSYGHYHVVICIKNNIEYFGKIQDNKMNLNLYGKIATYYWKKIPDFYSNIKNDKFIVMPDHIHGIIVINNENYENHVVGTEHCSVPTRKILKIQKKYGLLSKIIKSFKEITTKTIRKKYNDYNFQWQRSYYDHIIRNQESLYNHRNYIINNPINWKNDRNNVK